MLILAQSSTGSLCLGCPCDSAGKTMSDNSHTPVLADFGLGPAGATALNAAGSLAIDAEGNVTWTYTAADTANLGPLQVLCKSAGYAMLPRDLHVGGVALTTAAMNLVAREACRIIGTAWHVVYGASEHMSGAGYDGLSWATAFQTAGPGVKTAIEAAAFGDAVLLGPGTFALGNAQIFGPAGVSVIGSGRGVTQITSSLVLDPTGNNNTVIVLPGSHSLWEGITVQAIGAGTVNGQVGFGTFAPLAQNATPFTNVLVRGCRFVGNMQGMLIYASEACDASLEDCVLESQWDGGRVLSGAHTVRLRSCRLVANAAGGSQLAVAYGQSLGSFTAEDSDFIADGSTWGNQAVQLGINGYLLRGSIKSGLSAAGNDAAIYANGSAVKVSAVGVAYDRTKTLGNGTVIDTDRVATDTLGRVATSTPAVVNYTVAAATAGEAPAVDITLYQYAAIGPITIVAATSQTGKQHKLVAFAAGTPTAVAWSLGNAAISVAADGVTLTIAADATNTQAAGSWEYALWNTTDNVVVCRGSITVQAMPSPS